MVLIQLIKFAVIEDDISPDFCFYKYEWKIENNQKKVRQLYGIYDKPLYEKWCNINFVLIKPDELKVEKNDCGIYATTYEKNK